MSLFSESVREDVHAMIKLASPEEIRSWSYGEVKKPETINYRTYRPEKEGLFCERIFGPERDWECFCGKYKGIKFKGIVCDRCGVEITLSRVRRKRMGHINLAAPVAHIWFFKTVPSRIGAVLGVKTSALERVIYYQDYIVTSVKGRKIRELNECQTLSEERYRELKEQYRDEFEAEMGASAIRGLMEKANLQENSDTLRKELKMTTSAQKIKDIVKRLRTIEVLIESGVKPGWMVMSVIPVIPPDLRPLVLLDSGNFATSDLNDLYRRLINRNNRLRKLLDLNAPDVIIRNEKRMLQQSVDALFDNARCGRSVLGTNNRPLKSLSDTIKGKQGRFRENLLGKRVDYSARSVIVVGPTLKLNQCGIPKKIALELYQPFIIRKLKDLGKADTIKSAKKMLERREESVWDILDEVIKDHPVMLNRAPTLHRMGIQAFDPILVEGNAITLHPLVCAPFNADFDGDQMAVHLPLSLEAQVEARILMMSTQNVFSPSHGNPIITPTQDIVLGCFYLTVLREGEKGEKMVFSSTDESLAAYDHGKLGIHAQIAVRLPADRVVMSKTGADKSPNNRYQTSVGRIIVNSILPEGMPFYNYDLNKKRISSIIHDCFRMCGKDAMLKLLDDFKYMGFRMATEGGISIAKDDMKIPVEKDEMIRQAAAEVEKIERNYHKGVITPGERYNQIIDCWTHAREQVTEAMMKGLRSDTRDGMPYLNPIRLMVDSGARGSQDQIRQLAGMRGLMAKPSGKIIETPITSNFREGLGVLEYFSSTHGARKGLADTALKTADAGYLTRKLVDVAQNVVVMLDDCKTLNGITKGVVYKGESVEVSLKDSIIGRIARDNITNIITDEVVVKENELVTEEIASKIEEMGYGKIRVRSPLTCDASHGVCAKCYGMDLSTGMLVEEGLAVGIIAAQSIGEPGTQLTMRTFHIGGVAVKTAEESKIFSKNAGAIRLSNVKTAVGEDGQVMVLNRNGYMMVVDDKEREVERYIIPIGAALKVKEGQKVKALTQLVRWDPHIVPILAGKPGVVRYEDMIKNETLREEKDPRSGVLRKVIMEHKGEKHPQIVIVDDEGTILEVHPVHEKAHVEVDEGEKIKPGAILAKTPREITGTQDITGGLPRVTELFEARKPKDPCVISEIDGVVELGEKRRGRRLIIVKNEESSMARDHLVPHGKQLRVHAGDHVKAGDQLAEGSYILHDILRISGEEAVQQHLLQEIQSVYRAQNVTINDKHVELIVSQMLRKVRVQSPGDSLFLPNQVVDRFRLKDANQLLKKAGKKSATFKPLILGITKASIQAESFLSAAAFQETTRVLTEASLAGKRDDLIGLKENIIVGHKIPAGTGYPKYLEIELKKSEESLLDAIASSEPQAVA